MFLYCWLSTLSGSVSWYTGKRPAPARISSVFLMSVVKGVTSAQNGVVGLWVWVGGLEPGGAGSSSGCHMFSLLIVRRSRGRLASKTCGARCLLQAMASMHVKP